MRRMMIAVPTCAFAWLGIGACGGQVVVGGARPGDGGVETSAVVPEAASPSDAANAAPPGDAAATGETGVTAGPMTMVAADMFPTMPGQESTVCQVFANPFGRDVDLTAIQVLTDAHDVFVFSLPPTGSAGVPVAPTGLTDCSTPDPLGNEPILYYADQPSAGLTFPQSMGYPLPSSNALEVRAHYLNVTNGLVQAQTTLSFGVGTPGTVTTYVGRIFLSKTGFAVDASADGGPFVQESNWGPLPRMENIFMSWSFTSPAQAEVRAEVMANSFYDVTSQQTYSPLMQHNPPIQSEAGEAIVWSCAYPTTDVAPKATCVYQAFYYPADAANPDIVTRL